MVFPIVFLFGPRLWSVARAGLRLPRRVRPGQARLAGSRARGGGDRDPGHHAVHRPPAHRHRVGADRHGPRSPRSSARSGCRTATTRPGPPTTSPTPSPHPPPPGPGPPATPPRPASERPPPGSGPAPAPGRHRPGLPVPRAPPVTRGPAAPPAGPNPRPRAPANSIDGASLLPQQQQWSIDVVWTGYAAASIGGCRPMIMGCRRVFG
jgi:hypothetical protein